MTGTYYDLLGVTRDADDAALRSAYRQLVLKYHPDRNPDPRATETFLRVNEAYEALRDPERRRRYDAILDRQSAPPSSAKPPGPKAKATEPKRPAPRAPGEAPSPPRTHAQRPSPPKATTKSAPSSPPGGSPGTTKATSGSTVPDPREETLRLTHLLAQNRYHDAERLARAMAQGRRGGGLPHAVLGDIARNRGELRQAAGHYAFAVQADPRNALYQRRYEEMLEAIHRRVPVGLSPTGENPVPPAPLFAGALVVGLSTLYVALSGAEGAAGARLFMSWTLGLLMALFVSGLAIGVSLALSRRVDAFLTTVGGSVSWISPSVLLGLIALANFWLAAALYLVVGASQQAFNRSTTRVVVGTALATLMFTLASGVHGTLNPVETLLWGGNVIYIGALMGWMVADGLRP